MRKKIITNELLQAYAIEIIKTEGLEACSMRNLAKKAGIAVGTLYNYYDSHQKLLADVFNSSWEQTIKRLSDSYNLRKTPEENVAVYCKILFEEIRERKGLGKEVIKPDTNILSNNAPYFELMDKLTDSLKNIIKHGESNKNLPDSTIDMISKWAFLAVMSQIQNPDVSEEDFIQQLCRRFL